MERTDNADSAETETWAEVMGPFLALIGPPHAERKRASVLALMDARLNGKGLRYVWGRPGVCSRNAWYKWLKNDLAFARAVQIGEGLALEKSASVVGAMEAAALSALEMARREINLRAPDAVRRVLALMDSAELEQVQLGAAKYVLDRALGQPNQPLSGPGGEPLLPMAELVAALRRAQQAGGGRDSAE